MGLPERFLRTEQNIQLSYELSHRIYAASQFPILAPNGSSIIIYGHESGVRILWRGGRAFKSPSKPKANGAAATADAVMILDSDDEQPAAEPEVEFEDAEADADPSRPFPPVLRHIDLVFGTAATHLAVSAAVDGRIVFAATCEDSSIRLVSLPAAPPFPAMADRKDNKTGKWGETVLHLSGFSTPADGITMTFAKKHDEEMKSDGFLVIASHSREVTGLLLLHKIPVITSKKGDKTEYQLSTASTTPFQTQYLSTPASSIDFNPASGNLVLADKAGTIRIYSPDVNDGSWLLTLHTGFIKSDTTSFSSRKPILDAKWVLGGKAIIVLLSDGEWGVWDIEGAGPGASKGLLGAQNIRGGALTPFAISGYIDGPPSKSTSRPSAPLSRFAPMTPATRRTIEPTLFAAHSSHAATAGQISVATLPKPSTTSPADERVAFWLEDAFAVVPSLRAFWDAQLRRGGSLFSAGAGGRLVRVDNVNLRGERCSSFAQSATAPAAGVSPELVIAAEHRLVIVADLPEVRSALPRQAAPPVAGGPKLFERAPGVLDIAGIASELDRMDDGGDGAAPFAKRVSVRS